MQMTPYPLDRLFGLLWAHGCHRVCAHFSGHDGNLRALLIIPRQQSPLFLGSYDLRVTH
jgi:hypothetical protein